jgi:hypothetical protein
MEGFGLFLCELFLYDFWRVRLALALHDFLFFLRFIFFTLYRTNTAVSPIKTEISDYEISDAVSVRKSLQV